MRLIKIIHIRRTKITQLDRELKYQVRWRTKIIQLDEEQKITQLDRELKVPS